MSFNYLVLGAGRQGVALGYDLAANCEAHSVTLADVDRGAAEAAVQRLERLLPPSTCRFVATACDVSDRDAAALLMTGTHVTISAAPYRFNVALTDAAIAARTSFCDLGGNTDIVRQQLARHDQAAAAGVSIVPDCGLAPGLGNILAAYGISQIDEPRDVHVRCGGLPQQPVGPLGYKLLFNFQGLINEYSGFGEFLRDGQHVQLPALTELEPIEFPDLGMCEAAVTSGGTSTCPDSFFGKLRSYDYKTVRYPGHFAVVRAMFELGCFEERLTLRDGTAIEPKAILRRLLEDRLSFPDVRDLVVLRVIVRGRHAGREVERRFDVADRHDERTGFTAMERTTAFPTALVAHLQARKLISPGARPLEQCLPLAAYFSELPQHGIYLQPSGG